jgi:hypothetical protein
VGTAHAILLVMRDGNACGARHPEGARDEPQAPMGFANLTCYLAPRRISASEMTSSTWPRSYRFVIPFCPQIRAPLITPEYKECSITGPPLQSFFRFVAIDIHKSYLMIGAIDS